MRFGVGSTYSDLPAGGVSKLKLPVGFRPNGPVPVINPIATAALRGGGGRAGLYVHLLDTRQLFERLGERHPVVREEPVRLPLVRLEADRQRVDARALVGGLGQVLGGLVEDPDRERLELVQVGSRALEHLVAIGGGGQVPLCRDVRLEFLGECRHALRLAIVERVPVAVERLEPPEQRHVLVDDLQELFDVLPAPHLPVAERRRQQAEVGPAVGHDLADHHLRVAEQLVLVAIQLDRRVEQAEEEVVVEVAELGDVLAIQLVLDELGAHRVRVGDEVGARRVEGVDEAGRFAHQGPAVLAREHTARRVREVLDAQEVEHVLLAPLDLGRELRLVPPHPVEEALERVDLVERMEPGVGADADADRPRGELDQPQPVARSDQVGGRKAAQAALRHPAEPLLVVGPPLLEVEAAGQPEPHRVRVMAGVGAEVELPAQQVRAPARVDDPASRDGGAVVLLAERDLVLLGSQLDLLDAPATEGVRAGLAAAPEELVLEAPAVDLVREGVEVRRRAELDPLRDVAVVPGRQVEAKPELAKLLLLEVVAHADNLAVVVSAVLDARLAHLEGRVGRGLEALVGDQHAGVWALALQLKRHRQAGEAPAEHCDVVVPRGHIQSLELHHRRGPVSHSSSLAPRFAIFADAARPSQPLLGGIQTGTAASVGASPDGVSGRSQTISPSDSSSSWAFDFVVWTQVFSPSPRLSSTRTSKPRWTIRSIIASAAPSVGSNRISTSCGRTQRPDSSLTGPTKPITKSLAGCSYSSFGEPTCSIFPSFSTTICSATSIASSWSWVTNTVVTCTSSWRRRSQARSSLRTVASRAPNGSSSNRTRGCTASARASAMR